jgi:chromate reductase
MNQDQTRHRIAIVVGSLREGSLNRKLAQAICGSVPHSLECSILEIGDLPLYDPDLDREPPAPWARFRQELGACDGVLFVTPEYNRGIPSALKNAIDVGSRPYGHSAWAKKPTAVVTGSPGGLGGYGCNHQLRQCCVFLDMPVMQQPEAYVGHLADEKFGPDGQITDESLAKLVSTLGEAFAAWVQLIHAGRAALQPDPSGAGA